MCGICEGMASLRARKDVSRRRFLARGSLALGGLALGHRVRADEPAAPPKPQNVVSGDEALGLLQKGNARYIEGASKRHDFKAEREPLVSGQNPYAGVLSCADSRIAPEYAFDTGRGDLFVCRVAGNFANHETIASFEYAVAILGLPLILVLGHESCGAIDATLKSMKERTTLPGHMPSLVAALSAAAQTGVEQEGDPLANAIRQNVIDTVETLKKATPILSEATAQGKLKIVGGIYQLADGKVEMVA